MIEFSRFCFQHQIIRDDQTSHYGSLTANSNMILQNCERKLSNSSKISQECPNSFISSKKTGSLLSSNKSDISNAIFGFNKVNEMPVSNLHTCRNFEIQCNQEIDCISYAGSRFHRPPKPNALPKPPSHWVESNNIPSINRVCNNDCLDNITVHLKGLLKVQG